MVIGKIKNMSLGNGDMGIYWGYTLDMMGFKKMKMCAIVFCPKPVDLARSRHCFPKINGQNGENSSPGEFGYDIWIFQHQKWRH